VKLHKPSRDGLRPGGWSQRTSGAVGLWAPTLPALYAQGLQDVSTAARLIDALPT